MLRIAICDDVQEELNKIRQAAEAYFRDSREPIAYATFTSSFAFTEAMEKGAQFDIILLDICMPGLLGTDVAKELRKQDTLAELIFLTTSDEFAVEAFSVKATDYVLKPFTQAQFDKALDRAVAMIRQRNSSKVLFRLLGGGVRIESVSQILYLESNGHILTVHLADDTSFETRKSMMDIKANLDKIAPGQFLSPNKGYLVNLAHIHIIKSDSVEVQNVRIPLGKRKYREFQQQYFEFMFKP